MDFRILGPLEIWDEGAEVHLSGDRQRALLAILLLHAGEAVSTDRLMDDLWGDSQPAAGTTALRVRVSQLRKALGEDGDRLAARAHGYVLSRSRSARPAPLRETRRRKVTRALAGAIRRAPSTRLHEALALWRGAPLADFTYAPFAQGAIARLEELRLAAIELRIEADLSLGRHAALVGELETLVAEHPLRERSASSSCSRSIARDARPRRSPPTAARAAPARRRDRHRAGPGAAGARAQDPRPRPAHSTARSRRPCRDRTLLVAATGGEALEGLRAFAEPLADRPGDELVVATLVGDGTELAHATARAETLRESAAARGLKVRVATFVSDDPGADTARLVAEQDATLLRGRAPDGRGTQRRHRKRTRPRGLRRRAARRRRPPKLGRRSAGCLRRPRPRLGGRGARRMARRQSRPAAAAARHTGRPGRWAPRRQPAARQRVACPATRPGRDRRARARRARCGRDRRGGRRSGAGRPRPLRPLGPGRPGRRAPGRRPRRANTGGPGRAAASARAASRHPRRTRGSRGRWAERAAQRTHSWSSRIPHCGLYW